MPRVASLYLPNLAIDRIRRIEGTRAAARPDQLPPVSLPSGEAGWLPPARWPENAKERAKLLALYERKAAEATPPGSENEETPGFATRSGGWRPGARWAQEAGSDEWLERRIARKGKQRAALQAEIETLPLHQRPPVRELGRRSEAMPHPFRPMLSDEAGAVADQVGRGRYDLEGAFWQQGRTLGGAVARAVGASQTAAAPAPEVDDQPALVTIRRDRQRMVIAAACPKARGLGLAAGMALAKARAMVPDLAIRQEDEAGEAADLARLARHAVKHWTPLVMTVAGEGLWLEIGGSAHLFGGEAEFARRVLRLCRRLGFSARIAVAGNAVAAHALAKCASEPLTICPPGREAEAVAALPLEALQLSPDTILLARRLGIESVGALLAMPRAPLVRRFGNGIAAKLDEARSARAAPLDPLLPSTRPSAGRNFSEPILTEGSIAHALRELVSELAQTLLEAGLGARSVACTLTRVDALDQRICIGLARSSRDPDHIARLLCARIETIEPGFGIEKMMLVAERVEALAPQPVQSPLGDQDSGAGIALLVDKLATRLGWNRLYRTTAVESDVPERSCERVQPLGDAARCWGPWPRPVRLLDRPEPLGDVLALLPDGFPRRFTWRGRSYTVKRGDGPERIYGEWWRRTGEQDAVRDYFQVEDQFGARFWLFRRGDGIDPATGDMSWHIHGLFG